MASEHEPKLSEIRKRWIGRVMFSSVDHQLPGRRPSGAEPRPITEISVNSEGQWVAWAGEHLRANSPEALERRLRSLAYPAQ